jgi:hypothetical protein
MFILYIIMSKKTIDRFTKKSLKKALKDKEESSSEESSEQQESEEQSSEEESEESSEEEEEPEQQEEPEQEEEPEEEEEPVEEKPPFDQSDAYFDILRYPKDLTNPPPLNGIILDEFNEEYDEIEEKPIKKSSDRIQCKICGGVFSRSYQSRHNKTKHHLYVKSLQKRFNTMLIK